MGNQENLFCYYYTTCTFFDLCNFVCAFENLCMNISMLSISCIEFGTTIMTVIISFNFCICLNLSKTHFLEVLLSGCTTLRYKTFPVQCKKNNEAGHSLNAVEHKPVPTRVINHNASEASYYKPKQHSYRMLCTVTSLRAKLC